VRTVKVVPRCKDFDRNRFDHVAPRRPIRAEATGVKTPASSDAAGVAELGTRATSAGEHDWSPAPGILLLAYVLDL
jgi:hypothetical protein